MSDTELYANVVHAFDTVFEFAQDNGVLPSALEKVSGADLADWGLEQYDQASESFREYCTELYKFRYLIITM